MAARFALAIIGVWERAVLAGRPLARTDEPDGESRDGHGRLTGYFKHVGCGLLARHGGALGIEINSSLFRPAPRPSAGQFTPGREWLCVALDDHPIVAFGRVDRR